MLRLNIIGWIDIAAAILIHYTVTPVPSPIPEIHTAFLLMKGGIGFFPLEGLTPVLLPIYYLGGVADILSAVILLLGSPPVLSEYTSIIAGFLMIKGVWTFTSML